jgi:L-aminopeptidase/D-esterase-like protein
LPLAGPFGNSDNVSNQVEAPIGSITDVPGVLVGHHQRLGRGWQTGTTAVIVPAGATPGVDVRGGGPGTRETDALGPQKLVPTIHGLCLTGGSAYGLRAADGVMDWLEEQGIGFRVGPEQGEVVPVVPAAVIFDLGRGGSFRNRPDAAFGRRAARNASPRQARWGSVGAGAGARAGGLQGGIGTASRTVTIPSPSGAPTTEVVVGAVAVVNANGSVVNPARGSPWEPGTRRLRRPPAAERRALLDTLRDQIPTNLNTTIGVVATSATLSKAEVATLATVSHDGLARAIRPAHSMVDGDTIFGLATGRHTLPEDTLPFGDPSPRDLSAPDGPPTHVMALNLLLGAAADSFADACTHAVLAATGVGDLPSYLELCPSAR